MRNILANFGAVVLGLACLTSSALASPIVPGTYTLANATFTINSVQYSLTGQVTLNSSGDVTARLR